MRNDYLEVAFITGEKLFSWFDFYFLSETLVFSVQSKDTYLVLSVYNLLWKHQQKCMSVSSPSCSSSIGAVGLYIIIEFIRKNTENEELA